MTTAELPRSPRPALGNKLLGKTIRRYRRFRGYTQAQLGDQVEISRENISHIENGRIQAVDSRLLARIQTFLRIPLAEFAEAIGMAAGDEAREHQARIDATAERLASNLPELARQIVELEDRGRA